jgi:hypothetical protein
MASAGHAAFVRVVGRVTSTRLLRGRWRYPSPRRPGVARSLAGGVLPSSQHVRTSLAVGAASSSTTSRSIVSLAPRARLKLAGPSAEVRQRAQGVAVSAWSSHLPFVSGLPRPPVGGHGWSSGPSERRTGRRRRQAVRRASRLSPTLRSKRWAVSPQLNPHYRVLAGETRRALDVARTGSAGARMRRSLTASRWHEPPRALSASTVSSHQPFAWNAVMRTELVYRGR